MLYLIWSILNISLFLFFLYVCFRATKLLKDNHGIFLAVVFLIGLIGLAWPFSPDKGNTAEGGNQLLSSHAAVKDSLKKGPLSYTTIELEKNLLYTYHLGISYASTGQDSTLPVSAQSWVSGFQSRTRWVCTGILLNPTDDPHQFTYEVVGILQWSLLGVPVYAQPRQWKGMVTLK